jgi:hypothetical protein
MNPRSDFIRTLAELPIAPGVEAHSIIAVDGDGPLADASDGVVRYESAHLDGVSSEAIVHSGHSAQGNPEAIEEIRRICWFTCARSGSRDRALIEPARSRSAAGCARVQLRDDLRRTRGRVGSGAQSRRSDRAGRREQLAHRLGPAPREVGKALGWHRCCVEIALEQRLVFGLEDARSPRPRSASAGLDAAAREEAGVGDVGQIAIRGDPLDQDLLRERAPVDAARAPDERER